MADTKRPSEEAYRRAERIVRKLTEWGNQVEFSKDEWDHYAVECVEEIDEVATLIQPIMDETEIWRGKAMSYHRRAQMAEGLMGKRCEPMVWKFIKGIGDDSAAKLLAMRHMVTVMDAVHDLRLLRVMIGNMRRILESGRPLEEDVNPS